MVIVTHEMGFARESADRDLLPRRGRILEEGTTEPDSSEPPKDARTHQFLQRIIEAGRL